MEAGGKRKTVRALFDTGSQRSYILKSTIGHLRAAPERFENLTHVVFGGASTTRAHKCYRVIASSLNHSFSCDLQVLDQDIICGNVPSIQKGPWIEEMASRGIYLTDVGMGSQRVELLIGADYAGCLFTGNLFEVASGLVAMETCLGWSVMGKPELVYAGVTSLFSQSSDFSESWRLETKEIADKFATEKSKERDEDEIEEEVVNGSSADRPPDRRVRRDYHSPSSVPHLQMLFNMILSFFIIFIMYEGEPSCQSEIERLKERVKKTGSIDMEQRKHLKFLWWEEDFWRSVVQKVVGLFRRISENTWIYSKGISSILSDSEETSSSGSLGYSSELLESEYQTHCGSSSQRVTSPEGPRRKRGQVPVGL